MTDVTKPNERKILQSILDGLHNLDDATRARILKSAEIFYGIDLSSAFPAAPATAHNSTSHSERSYEFGKGAELSPKEFLLQKKPATDMERVACLAYYLAQYRGVPHFRTVDISKLNTEAAQIKLSNAAYAVSHASAAGFIVPAGKGAKQISALGERYVDALPDRAAAREAVSHLRRRRAFKRGNAQRPTTG